MDETLELLHGRIIDKGRPAKLLLLGGVLDSTRFVDGEGAVDVSGCGISLHETDQKFCSHGLIHAELLLRMKKRL